MNGKYEDFKYVIADLSRIYFGARYSYRELTATGCVWYALNESMLSNSVISARS